MKIKSVSQLDEKKILTIPQLMQQQSYIETSFLTSSPNDEISAYFSYKFPFDQYNGQISNLVDDIKAHVDEKCKELSNLIDKLSSTVLDRLHQADLSIESFMREADDIFVHKNQNYGKDEYIYGKKIFLDSVYIKGPDSMLSSQNIIEGTSRRALWS